MLNERLVAELVRQRVGEEDASRSARYIFLIPEALKATARKIAANVNLRDLLLTDKNTVAPELLPDPATGNGVIDLKPLYAEHRILKEYIDCGLMYADNSDYPLQKTAAHKASLQRHLSRNFTYYYIEGDSLYVLDTTEGAIAFAVPYYPATLADLPDSEEVEVMFISKLIELANTGSDAAEDGEK